MSLLVVVLSAVVLDRGRIPGAISKCRTCAADERPCGQHDSHNNVSHGHILAPGSLHADAESLRPRRAPPPRPSPTSTAIAPDLGRPEIGSSNAPSDRSVSGQREHRELAAERCVILQGSIATNGAQAGGGIRQPGGKTDTCPAADAGQNRDVLLATMLIGG